MADHNDAGGTLVGKVSRDRLDEIHWKSMDGREDKIKIHFKGIGLKWFEVAQDNSQSVTGCWDNEL